MRRRDFHKCISGVALLAIGAGCGGIVYAHPEQGIKVTYTYDAVRDHLEGRWEQNGTKYGLGITDGLLPESPEKLRKAIHHTIEITRNNVENANN